MSKDKIRIGIIGTGIIGEEHIKFYRDIPEAEVVAICNIGEDRLNEIGDRYGIKDRYTNIGQVLARDDIDAIDVCVHNNSHAPIAIAAMEAGKDVYCEKSMAGSYYDAKMMYDTMKRTGRKLHVQLWFIYDKETRAAKRFIDAGDLGKIYHMRSTGFRRRGRPYVDGFGNERFCNSEFSGGGVVVDMAIYHIATLLYLSGLPKLQRVTGHIYSELPMDEKRREFSNYNVEELAVGLATYENGLTMDLIESWAIHGSPFAPSTLYGNKGGITLNPFQFHTRMNNMEVDCTVDLAKMDYLDHTVYPEFSHYDGSQQHWIHALLGKCELLPTAEIALETMLLEEGIYLSAKLGREVTADEIREMSVSTAQEVDNLIWEG